MRILFFIFCLLISSANDCFTQNIQRKAMLGVSFYNNMPDSIVKKFNYKKGAIIQFIVPNTTASVLNIQPNDIVIRVNETEINKPNELFIAAKKLRASEQTTVTLIRNGKEMTLTGKAVERPKETDANANVVYGEFAYKSGYVRTIYKTLKGKQPIGTIYFLQGLPCYSMDNFQQLDKTKQALDAMVERGFAVYRMEKADMGDNVNQSPCETMGFDEELAMYEAGYKHLLTLKEVDTSKIFLFGHSMGGVTAPLLAQKFQPKGVAVYGTVFKPWMDYMLDAFLIQGQYQGYDLALLQDELQQFKPFLYDYFFGKKTLEEIAATPKGLAALQNILDYTPSTKLAASGRSPLVFKEINQHNLAKAWGNTKSYVLAVYGECDIAANNADDHKALINYVNKIHPGKGTFWQAPGTTHTFEEIGTMEEFMKWQKNMQAYLQYAATKFNPKVFDYVCNWMKEVVEKS
jgi:uncharacterized protein